MLTGAMISWFFLLWGRYFLVCMNQKFMVYQFRYVSDITSSWHADARDEHLKDGGMPRWVALAVVQSYNSRRKVPRSSVSTSDLELCLSKASYVAAQKSGNTPLSYL